VNEALMRENWGDAFTDAMLKFNAAQCPKVWLNSLTLETVIVHLKGGGPSFKGVLTAVHADCLVLRDAMVLEPDSQVILDGDVVVPRPNVDFMQRIGGASDHIADG
jgi:hypothetical protein